MRLDLMNGPVLCPFRLCTGHACPGCGITRAVVATIRGEWDLAWQYHPFVFALAFQLLVAAGVMAFFDTDWIRRRSAAIVSLNLLALVGLWVARWNLDALDVVIA